jgi:hypothetical protein
VEPIDVIPLLADRLSREISPAPADVTTVDGGNIAPALR